MNGALVIDKPEGLSSHDVVAAARRALGVSRIGHTGTLDPMATGVLVLLVGRATRLARFLSTEEKTYDATVRLGLATDTYDITGRSVRQIEDPAWPRRDEVDSTLDRYRGRFDQVPPPFSAKRIGGVRAYRLARRRRTVTLDAVPVTVHDLRIVSYETGRVRLLLTCSAGFYVRSLAHALGEDLGTGGCLERLRRERIGEFELAEALPLETLVKTGSSAADFLLPMERLVANLEAVVLTAPGARRAAHGNALRVEHVGGGGFDPTSDGGLVRLLGPEGALLGLARRSQGPEVLRPHVVLV
jgi:tRNA pseudouridine55 synthase